VGVWMGGGVDGRCWNELAPSVAEERGDYVEAKQGDGTAVSGMRKIDLENSDAPESQPWELPSPPRLAVLDTR
jgi:hypothetical protein